MAYFFSRYNINHVIISYVLVAFTLTYAFPIHALDVSEVAFLYRVEKLVEKTWKLAKSENQDKMYTTIIDLKAELEASSSVKINLSKCMDDIEKELKKEGLHLQKTSLIK